MCAVAAWLYDIVYGGSLSKSACDSQPVTVPKYRVQVMKELSKVKI